MAVVLLLTFFSACKKSENENTNDNVGDTGLENTSSDVSKAVGDTMPVEVGTGMDTTAVGGKATVGAAANGDAAADSPDAR